MAAQINNVTFVIRTAGERTLEACRKLALQQVSGEVVVINERPFEKALQKTYEVGIARNTKWTMTLDADVLLRAGAVNDMLAEAERMPEHFVQIEGRILDKFSGTFRQAGHRVYRTELLGKVMSEIPTAGTEHRPETATLARMARRGHPSMQVGVIAGLHDFEQSYADIYRKCYVHAQKHLSWLPSLIERWRRLAPTDPDYRVALRGLADGIVGLEWLGIDVRRYDHARSAIESLGLTEKEALSSDAIGDDAVTKALEAAGRPSKFRSRVTAIDGKHKVTRTRRVLKKLSTEVRRFLGSSSNQPSE